MKLSTLFLLVFLIFGLALRNSLCVDEGGEAYSAVEEADNALKQAFVAVLEAESEVADCYGAVVDAERAGANVTDLLNTLNEAGMLLSRAYLAYSVGDFGSARDFAVWCMGNLTGFVDEADALKQNAMQERYWDFMVNVVGSSVGAVAVVVGGFALWSFLKRKYDRGEAHLQQ